MSDTSTSTATPDEQPDPNLERNFKDQAEMVIAIDAKVATLELQLSRSPAYWDLGKLSVPLKKEKNGNWLKYLKDQKIPQRSVNRAITIFEGFPERGRVVGLTLDDAEEKARRNIEKKKGKKKQVRKKKAKAEAVKVQIDNKTLDETIRELEKMLAAVDTVFPKEVKAWDKFVSSCGGVDRAVQIGVASFAIVMQAKIKVGGTAAPVPAPAEQTETFTDTTTEQGKEDKQQ